MTQEQALEILKTGASVFLTGEPGSGKTHTINEYVKWLRMHDIEPAITASTGIAATHIGGFTIHSWSGIGIRRRLTDYDLDKISQNKRIVGQVRTAKILIIDEISMLSADTFQMVDAICREIRQNGQPFGGLQMVLVGDFFQLPPICRDESGTGRPIMRTDESIDSENSFLERGNGPKQFAFNSYAWKNLNPIVCYLSEQHRQEDPQFLDFLTAIRRGKVAEKHHNLLSSRHNKTAKENTTQLYSHNVDVDRINNGELAKLKSSAETFEMHSMGRSNFVEALKRGCLSPEILTLKIGAKVMFTKNDILTHKFVNGTIGDVIDFSKDSGYPIVRTKNGRLLEAEPMEWSLEDGGKILAKIIQVPLRLAWAITVHKSQGMSLDCAHMDLSGTFEFGQGYVALSRVRTLQGLSIAGINQRALEVHPEILMEDKNFKLKSAEARAAFDRMEKAELENMQRNFISAAGGKWETGLIVRNGSAAKINKRIDTCSVTFQLISKGKTVSEVAKIRGIGEETVISHLEKLQSKKLLPIESIAHLIDSTETDVKKIQAAFKASGGDLLRPVYEQGFSAIDHFLLHKAD
ncbi:MAG: AAA family ATPase [Candidatus Taylorbacteria bacterium]|nr:AAA family ATPase [Candidatus Taylorbacteria bacterium]